MPAFQNPGGNRRTSIAGMHLTVAWSLLLLSASGCMRSSVHWLPDSRAFLFEYDGKVTLYDVAKRSSRTVLAATGSDLPATALRPDGKELVVVTHEGGPTTRLVFYGLDGRETRRSGVVDRGGSNEVDGMTGAAFWTPAADRILVNEKDGVAIYNVRDNTFKVLDGVHPVSYFGTPIRPDGKGFVAYRDFAQTLKRAECFFFNWDGGGSRLMETAAFLTSQKRDDDRLNRPNQTKTSPPTFPRTRWEGPKLVIWLGPVAVMEADTEKHVIDVRKDAEVQLNDKASALVSDEYTFPASNAVLRVVYDHTKSPDQRFLTKLELFAPKQKRSRTLRAPSTHLLLLFPSPDGKSVAVVEFLGELTTTVVRQGPPGPPSGGPEQPKRSSDEGERVFLADESGGEPILAFDFSKP